MPRDSKKDCAKYILFLLRERQTQSLVQWKSKCQGPFKSLQEKKVRSIKRARLVIRERFWAERNLTMLKPWRKPRMVNGSGKNGFSCFDSFFKEHKRKSHVVVLFFLVYWAESLFTKNIHFTLEITFPEILKWLSLKLSMVWPLWEWEYNTHVFVEFLLLFVFVVFVFFYFENGQLYKEMHMNVTRLVMKSRPYIMEPVAH